MAELIAYPKELQHLFNQAPAAIAMLIGPDHIIEYANDKMLEFWGKDQEVIGKPIIIALPEIVDQPFPDLLRKVYTTGIEKRGYETKAILERNGKLETYYFNYIYSPLRNEDGTSIIGISSIATEVTEQVLAKKELEESELRFQNLVLEADVATAIYTGEDMTIQLANEAMIKVWGKDASVIGKPLEIALPELEGQPFLEILRNVYHTGKTYKANDDEVKLIVNNRLKTFYFNFSYKALRNSKGEIYGILNMAVDVTEQVQARKKIEENETAVKTSEVRLREMADSMPQIVWTATADGEMDYFNRRWYEYAGSIEGGFNLNRQNNLFHPEDINAVEESWKNSLETGEPYQMEYRLQDPLHKHKYRWFLGRALAIRDQNGKIVRWIGTSTDIQEYKELQQQKDNFIGMASHELKTPVTSIKAYTQILHGILSDEGDDIKVKMVDKMDMQINRLTSLIDDLLDVTKIQVGKLEYNEEFFDFDEMVTDITANLQHTSARHKIIIKNEKIGEVYGDSERIGQVITNFITNAIKYSPQANQIIVSSRILDNEVEVCVEDFGIGIPEDKIKKIFEQFYRIIGNSHHAYRGIGLGLYISAEIIRRINGRIWAESIEGKGSKFYFTFPYTATKNKR